MPSSAWKKKTKNWCPPAPPYPQKVLIDPCSLDTHFKISKWISFTYGTGTFQTATFALGLEWVSFCMYPSRAEPQFPIALCLLDVGLTSFQSQMLWGLLFPVQVPWTWEPNVEFSVFNSLLETLRLCYLFYLWVTTPRVWVLARSYLCPSYLSQYDFSFLSLVVKNLFW